MLNLLYIIYTIYCIFYLWWRHCEPKKTVYSHFQEAVQGFLQPFQYLSLNIFKCIHFILVKWNLTKIDTFRRRIPAGLVFVGAIWKQEQSTRTIIETRHLQICAASLVHLRAGAFLHNLEIDKKWRTSLPWGIVTAIVNQYEECRLKSCKEFTPKSFRVASELNQKNSLFLSNLAQCRVYSSSPDTRVS